MVVTHEYQTGQPGPAADIGQWTGTAVVPPASPAAFGWFWPRAGFQASALCLEQPVRSQPIRGLRRRPASDLPRRRSTFNHYHRAAMRV
jgi:hypothetical protein